MGGWILELEALGWERMLLDRLKFHGGLVISDIVAQTQKSRQTVLRHCNRLVESKKAEWHNRADADRMAIVRPINR